MPPTKKPTKRPGAKKISKLTDAQRRTLNRACEILLKKTDYLKQMAASLTPSAKKQVEGEVEAIKRQIRRASNVIGFL